ncbi:hypothetical protein [Acinetobacter indicus]|uniref:hypothetical protein n=1 Tax=Acinetobacter indicus TaxID=756892 RepID=UPI00209AE10D|nr:hypothetical protein [Acinetobacter indicus]MCO8088257.1 hypothetical protein [Acinetobacter indicus]
MDRPLNLLAPYENSHTNGEDEKQLHSLFMDLFNEVFGQQINDIHHYGMPHLGSPKVVERFTKQDGLVVLRRPTSSDLLMRIIYANWKSLGSKRGLAFLEFVLQMLLGNQWKIHRLYHSLSLRAQYPELATMNQTADSFLTSRIMIDLSQDVDFEEILELAPVLFRLVPANIVPSLSSSLPFNDLPALTLAAGFIPYMSGYFQDMSGYVDETENLEWSSWTLNNYIHIARNGAATYRAFMSNGIEVVKSYAVYDLKPHVLPILDNSLYQNMVAVRSAIEALNGGPFSGYRFNALTGLVEVSLSLAPDDVDYAAVLDVTLERLAHASQFNGVDAFSFIVNYSNWFIEAGAVCQLALAPLSQRSPLLYQTTNIIGYEDYYHAAKDQVDYWIENDAAWADRVLGEFYLEAEFEQSAHYIQEYTAAGVPGSVLVVVNKSDNPEFVSEDAQVSRPVDRQRQLENLLYARNNPELSSYVQQVVDAAYSYAEPESSNELFDLSRTTYSRQQVADALIRNLDSTNALHASHSTEFLQGIANTALIQNPAFQIVKFNDLVPLFVSNAERVQVPDAQFIALTDVRLEVVEYV